MEQNGVQWDKLFIWDKARSEKTRDQGGQGKNKDTIAERMGDRQGQLQVNELLGGMPL